MLVETGAVKISKHKSVLEKDCEKSTIVKLPPVTERPLVAGVLLFEGSCKLDVGFLKHNERMLRAANRYIDWMEATVLLLSYLGVTSVLMMDPPVAGRTAP